MYLQRNSILCILFLLCSYSSFAQVKKETDKKEQELKEDNLNKTDKLNRKQGLWYFKKEASHGEPAYTTFGNFENDKKQGIWYKLDNYGQLMAIETFRQGQLNGNAQYYDKGNLTAIGNYRSLEQSKQLDSIWVTDPITLYDTLIVIPSEYGYVKHGSWRHYNPITGQLISEETYQIDKLIYKTVYHTTPKNDSAYISKRIEALPHNNYPKEKKPKRQNAKSSLYPNMNKKR